MDKCREEFEIFWTARCCGLGVECNLTTLINGDYYDIKAYYAWIGWKESRESLVVALPGDVTPEYEGDAASSRAEAAYCKGYNQAMTEAEELIESAGIKVE